MIQRTLVTAIVLAGVAATAFFLRNDPPASEQEVDSLRQLGAEAAQQMQQRLEQELAIRTTSDEQQRLDSPLGQALSRQCIEWTELSENHASPEINANRERACEKLQAWVRDGVEPERPRSSE